MNLKKAQHVLWSMLTDDERAKHVMVYKLALKNISDGITKTIVDYGKTEINTPAFLYFSQDEELDSQPNIVGQVMHNLDGNVIVIFESADIIELLELYYGNNILI
jgi:hypothetical protein